MPNPFNPSAQQSADVQQANVPAEPVEANSDGKDTQQQQKEERRYTSAETELIVKDRLAREQKKFSKVEDGYKTKLSELEKRVSGEKPSPNVEQDYQTKLKDYELKMAAMSDLLAKTNRESLKAKISSALSAQGCIDPDVAISHFEQNNLVHLDEDGSVVVENINNNLDELVADFLSKKPYLVKAQTSGGLGTKAPRNISAGSGSPSQMSTEDLAAQLGITPKKRLFAQR